MECTSVSERVKAYVVEKELSQKLIAKNMNISESRLSLMLNGKRVHKTLNSRGISGLIYFASAVTEE